MARTLAVSVLAVLVTAGLSTKGKQSTTWGKAIEGVQLRLAVSDGPLPRAGELPWFEVQLRHQGTQPVTFVGEAIVHPEIEIDGVWHTQVWAGSCCAAPVQIPPGGKSELVSIRVLPPQTFAIGVTPARPLALTSGRHSIRIRNASSDRIDVRLGSRRLVLTSNLVTVEVMARSVGAQPELASAPACEADSGRRSTRVHGALERGERFARTTPGGWILRLEPVEHGWVVQLSTPDRLEEDLSRLTPPWHSAANPRDLDGWHFRNVANTGPNEGSVNAPGQLREFIFSPLVGREIEYQGSATGSADVEKVRSFGRGWLFIESYRLTPVNKDERASFESLTFWACLTWPAVRTAGSSKSASTEVP